MASAVTSDCQEPTASSAAARSTSSSSQVPPDLEKLDIADRMDHVQTRPLPVVRQAWRDFLQYARKLQTEAGASEISAGMELSLNSDVPRWHFHLTLSNIRAARSDRDSASICFKKATLEEFAPKPVPRICTARGRSAEPAVHRLHCYSQWRKVGSVHRLDNFPRGFEFVCKASWTLRARRGRTTPPCWRGCA